uniref:Nucleoid DNA-binding protein n=1 Tax=Candidatus Kentrum sp. FM TaxID=2126340 RepID=A0A450TP08_9GAMM|nr:MAG: nucleoid DNA-binding protein [Candidatus Kentron sp. FM]VFJ69724.1 MAG: nucleoid DNA-binding protein [Candidatus Kentron sp. FM]VFK18287.1 MAG: nucleoid DNA-binding protein [Candidatus Kentron sp. FM]
MSDPKTENAAQELTAIEKHLNKSQLISALAEHSGVTKKDVTSVLDALSAVVSRHVRSDGAREFILPGLLKIRTVYKPATEERRGILGITGKETVFQAKPAKMMVKLTPLSGLKEMAQVGLHEEQ